MVERIAENKILLLKWAFTIIVSLVLFLIPDTGLYAGAVKGFFVITVFSLSIMAFEFFPPGVMPIVMPLLYVIFQIAPFEVVMSPWTTSTMMITIGAFLLSIELEESGFLNRVACYLMSKVNGSYTKLLVAIYFVGVLLTLVTLGAGYMFMPALCAGLCAALLAKKKKAGAGIAMACILGTCTARAFLCPITAFVLIRGAAGGLADDVNFDILRAIFHNCPMFLVCLFMVWLFAQMCKPKGEESKNYNGEYFKAELKKLGAMGTSEKKTAVLLFCVFGYIVTLNWHKLPVDYAMMLFPWLGFLPGVNIANESTFKKINWQMIFFTSGCLSIGAVATTIGLRDAIADICANLFSSGNVFVIFATVFILVFVLNFVMTPGAIWALLSAPLMSMAIQLGIAKLPFIYALFSCAEAVILPYEYPAYLLVYAFGMMTMGDFVKFNSIRCVIYFVAFIAILIPWWMLVGVL